MHQTQRRFFQSVPFLGAFLALAATPGWFRLPGWGTYGHVDVARARRCGWLPARVTLDGVDVSMDTEECDDRAGWVLVYAEIPAPFCGKYVDPATGELATVQRFGRVTFEPWTA